MIVMYVVSFIALVSKTQFLDINILLSFQNHCSQCSLTLNGTALKWAILKSVSCMSFLAQSIIKSIYMKITQNIYIFFYKFILFYFYFWLCWVFVAARGLSLVAASVGYSSLQCVGFSLRWLLLLRSTGSRCTSFSSCGTQAQQLWLTGSRAQAQQLWRTGLVAPQHVGSSWTRARTRVPCIGRWILNCCATREALEYFIIQCKCAVYAFKLNTPPTFPQFY